MKPSLKILKMTLLTYNTGNFCSWFISFKKVKRKERNHVFISLPGMLWPDPGAAQNDGPLLKGNPG
jgi:hypothetical protein